MVAAASSICDFGRSAPDFLLPATDGNSYALRDIAGPKGTLIAFICNHCPYVRSIVGRLSDEARELQAAGVGVAAVCSNDAVNYPEDSFPRMKEFAEANDFTFPYLHDESQDVARAYDAQCTPDFFGFDKNLGLQYRGRLDESKTVLVPDARRELHEAMMQVADTGHGPKEQIPSMGCSIKWRV